MRYILLIFALLLAGCKLYDIDYKDDEDDTGGLANCNELTTHQPFCINPATNIKLKLIAAGNFDMGAIDTDSLANANEKPHHFVTISKPFYIGVYEVSKTQWRSVMGGDRGSEPVTGVTWSSIADAGGFVRKLNADARIVIGGVAYEYALPSEAQWEYAARAGTTSPYPWGDAHGDHAWFLPNASGKTHAVGGKQPIAGLYDMAGNAAEWVQDCFGDYGSGAVTDPIVDSCSLDRVVRGGNFSSAAADLRSSARAKYPKSYSDERTGFRLALVPKRP
ncbi:hypothetical protein FACS189487_01020 [Campylobacterota bacterium]|nr:hypothetical protein FACS189487_01020 [Campylobacterota bacterium]